MLVAPVEVVEPEPLAAEPVDAPAPDAVPALPPTPLVALPDPLPAAAPPDPAPEALAPDALAPLDWPPEGDDAQATAAAIEAAPASIG
jgi:hypothetical protein